MRTARTHPCACRGRISPLLPRLLIDAIMVWPPKKSPLGAEHLKDVAQERKCTLWEGGEETTGSQKGTQQPPARGSNTKEVNTNDSRY